MKDFKDSTKVQYERGGCVGYAKGGSVKGAAKVAKVMREFKKGELHSGSKEGPKVKSREQAVAIALSEGRKASKKPVKKQDGGAIGRANRMQALEAREEEKLMREVPAGVTRANSPRYTEEPAEARSARAAPRPTATPTPAPRRGPAGQSFRVQPMYEVNPTAPTGSGARRLRGLESAARAVLPESAERALEGRGLLPRRLR